MHKIFFGRLQHRSSTAWRPLATNHGQKPRTGGGGHPDQRPPPLCPCNSQLITDTVQILKFHGSVIFAQTNFIFFKHKFCAGSQNLENLIYFAIFFGKFQFLRSSLTQKNISFLCVFFAHLAQPISLVHLTLPFMNGCFWIPAGKSWMLLDDYR